MRQRLIYSALGALVVSYAVFFSVQLFLHYYTFGSRAMDLGNFNQAIWHTINGQPFEQTNRPGATNRLSIHVEPILLPISLLYLIYPGPESLFVFQSIIIALGAVPVFALARFKFGSDALALAFATVYLLLPSMQGAALLDFHPGALAPTFLMAAFYFMETRRPAWFAVFGVLAASCKEDMVLIMLMMGVYAVVINRQFRLGGLTVGLSLLWAYLAVFVIPPQFAASDNIHWDRYGHLGDSAPEIVLNFVLRPDLVLTHLQAIHVFEYFRLLLTPTAFLALLNPPTLILAAPHLGINLLSNFSPMQRVNSLVYAAPLIPALMISSIYGLSNLRALLARVRWLNRPTVFHSVAGLSLLVVALTYQATYGYLPGAARFRGWPKITAHDRLAYDIFAQIPPEASLSAHDRLNPHVTGRETVYIFDNVHDAEYIVLDITEDSWPLHPVALRHRVDDFLAGEFGVVAADTGYLLLSKDSATKTIPDAFYDFVRVPTDFTPRYPARVVFDDKIELLGYDLTLGAHEHFLPVVTLYWRALEPLDTDYTLWPRIIDRDGKLIENTAARPLVATLWYPTSAWRTDEIIATSMLPRDFGEAFTLAAGVTRGAWSQPSERLPITAADRPLYEQRTWARLGTFQRVGRKQYEALTPPESPQPQTPHAAQFWNLINLRGIDLPATAQPGELLAFTLYWQAEAALTINVTTFAHLLDGQGQVVAQRDWTPQDTLGYLPTTAWQPGRVVVDSQTLALPADLSPGAYRLVLGWYYPVTGDRLPLTLGEGAGGDVLEVGGVNVE